MDKEHILSCSYGKDSLACIGACMELGWPIDRIVHAEVWATETIQADLPPMVEFKKKADAIIKERYGIEVEHTCAKRSFQMPLNVRGNINAHTRAYSTKKLVIEECKKEQNTEETSAITIAETKKFTDFRLCEEHGAIQGSRSEFSMQLPKATYEALFYKEIQNSAKNKGRIWGWPFPNAPWCNSSLKKPALNFPQVKEVRWCNI